MIVDALLELFGGFVEWMLSLFPDWTLPDWLAGPVEGFGAMSSPGGSLHTVMGHVAAFGAWVPLPLFGAVAASIAVCAGVGLTIKLGRIVASFATLGGGSAG